MGETIKTVGELAGICGHDGTNWEKVLIDASKRLVVAVASAVAQDCHQYQYDGSNWQKSNMLLGYNDILDVDFADTATGTSFNATSGNVPEGELWVVQAASMRDFTRSPSSILIYILKDSDASIALINTAAPGQNIPVLWTGNLVMAEGDSLRVYVAGTQADDAMYGGVMGYKMDLEM